MAILLFRTLLVYVLIIGSVPQCGARTEGRAFIFVQRRQRDEYRKKRKPVKTGFPHRF